jgi:hypothetical protein
MKRLTYIGLSLAVILSVGLTGCGGGDSGNTSNSGTSNLAFPSNAVIAEPTLTNGILVKDEVAKNQTSGIPMLNSIDSNTSINVALLGNNVSDIISKHIKDIKFNQYSLNETISNTFNCSNGGTYSVNGFGSNGSDGVITINYNQCNESGQIINGNVYTSISNYDSVAGDYKDLSIKFTSDFTTTTGNTVVEIIKNSYMNLNVLKFDSYGNSTEFKLTMSIQVIDGTTSFGQKDSMYYFITDGYNTAMYQTQGRIYIGNLASYVDYDTSYDMSKTPFIFSGSGIISGEARYNMSGSGKAKIVVENNKPITYVDADGDGTYELSELN